MLKATRQRLLDGSRGTTSQPDFRNQAVNVLCVADQAELSQQQSVAAGVVSASTDNRLAEVGTAGGDGRWSCFLWKGLRDSQAETMGWVVVAGRKVATRRKDGAKGRKEKEKARERKEEEERTIGAALSRRTGRTLARRTRRLPGRRPKMGA